MKMINSKIMLISLILILLFSFQAVSALDDNDFNQTNIASPILKDDGIKDYSFEDNVLRASSDNNPFNDGCDNSEPTCDLNQNNNKPIDSTADKLSATDDEGSSDENQNDKRSNITFDHRTSIDFVFEENTTISDELYKVIGIWDLPYYESAMNPWLMNDTTWVYCIDGNSRDPDGAMYFPGFYKRITLTDNDKFINRITGEDVLPYLTTYIYQNFNNSDKYGISSAGTVPVLIYVFHSFVHSDYRDPESLYNRRPAGSHGTIYDVVKEVLDTVDSGNGANCSGAFYGSDLLTYQFYLYVPVSELNDDLYQTTLGFNIFTKINVTKVWDDDGDFNNLRPENIDVQLYGNGKAIGDAIQLSEENNWTYTFTDLPVYYTYNNELVLSESDYSVASIMEDDVDLTLKKIWNESYTGNKPSVISCRLYGNGQYLGLIRLYSYMNWEQTIKNLPKYDEDGNEMVYSIVDITNYRNSTPTGYIRQNFSEVYQVKHLQYEITNEDLKNESRYVEVYKNGKYVDVKQISDSNNWTFTIYNLPADFPENDLIVHYAPSGNHVNIINYTINETNTSDTYIQTKESSSELINPLMPTQDQVTNKYCKYLDNDINRLLKNVTITNRLEVVSIYVNKEWDDDDDHDGFRPDKVTIHLTAGNKTIATVNLSGLNWNFTFKNLPKYHNCVLITYNVIEDTVDNYNVSYSSSSPYNFKIINSHAVEFVCVNVTKNWNDNFNQDGVRPANVTILLSADGKNIKNATLNESNNWKVIFSDLDKFKNGYLINYAIKESPTENYNTTITNCDNGNWIVNNTHIPAISDINVTKIWQDNDNQDGVRPANITVILKEDGNIIANATLNSSNNWNTVFKYLPVYKNGKLIIYSIQELTVNNYTSKISNNTQYNWTINNIHVPAVTDFNVTKIWEDNNNQDGVRPTNITVILKADGNIIESATLNSSNKWSISFKNLPVYKNGKLIKYSIGEINVAEYTQEITNDTAYGVIIFNAHIPKVTEVNVEKIWNDNDNQDGIRPTSITVVLLANGIKINETTLNTLNNWTSSFNNLPVYQYGNKIKYSIEELRVDNYTSTISNETPYKWIINNTYIPKVTEINVEKIWNDNDDQDRIRPVYVQVVLFADGIKVDEASLSAINNWKCTFSNLPVYNSGKSINYTVGEVEVSNYTVDIVGKNGNFTITNTHMHVYTPKMSVQKISLYKTVKVGQQVRFVIVVKNTGDCELTGVYVIDDDYTQGIVIDHMIPNSAWTFDGKSKFTYGKTLGIGESSNFTVVFNTTSVGLKFNKVTAGNNITNQTVHCTNSTNVTNETEPMPPKPIPPSPEDHKIPNEEMIRAKHATGNPIFVLLLVLFTLSVNISRKK